ncbi:MAG: AAA family ATPase [Myxococcales bacterium]|jgi:chromosome segregation protein
MHLTELKFWRVGHWANLEPLRFGPRVTVVLGDNEAGKSTAMRAIEALLFGPRRDLILPLASEQLFHASASARLPDGREVSWTWRDRKISPADAAEALKRAAPPETAARFRDLFRLGHDTVRRPASFLSEAGAIGSVLFAASSGASAARLAALEEELQKRLKSVESGAANKDGLPLHLRRCAELKAGLDARADFTAHDVEHGRLREVQGRIEELTREIRDIDANVARLDAYQKGLDEYAALREAEKELAAILARGPVPRAAWAGELEKAVGRVRDAAEECRTAEEKVLEAENELAQLPVVPPIAGFANAIDALVRQVGSVGKDREGLAKAQRSLADARRELRDLLAGFGKPTDEATFVETARGLVVPKHRREVFVDLLEAHRDAENECKSAAAARDTASRLLEDARSDAADHAERPIDTLEKARKQVTMLLQLEKEVQELKDARAKELAAAREAAVSLGLADKDCAATAALPIAERSALDAAWQRHAGARSEKNAREKELETAEGKLAETQEKVAALKLQAGAPPTVEALAAARAERQVAWEAVKSTWSPSWRPGAETELPGLGEAFERTVVAADLVADQRFDGAERVGALDAAEQAERDAALAVKKVRERLSRAADLLGEAEEQWARLWNFLPCPPASYQDWLAGHKRLCECVSRMATIESKLATQRAKAGDLRADVLELLGGTLPEACARKTAEALEADIESEPKRSATTCGRPSPPSKPPPTGSSRPRQSGPRRSKVCLQASARRRPRSSSGSLSRSGSSASRTMSSALRVRCRRAAMRSPSSRAWSASCSRGSAPRTRA